MNSVTTIVNYCSNDYQYLKKVVDSVLDFSEEVLVPVCDHFFDGKEENKGLLEKTFSEVDAKFLLWRFDPIIAKSAPIRYWNNLARKVAFDNRSIDTDFLLFLDADEIVDTDRFTEFFDSSICNAVDAMLLGQYFYFREPIYRAKTWEDIALLVRTSCVTEESIMQDAGNLTERHAIWARSPRRANLILGLDNKPMVHHYSWARTYKQMLRKVQSWSHSEDRDWETMVHEEFSRPFNGTDFVHGYKYDIVGNQFDIKLGDSP